MGRKSTSVSIKKKRLTDILEEHDLMNYAELGRILGYTREAITRSINREYMDTYLLNDICKLLDISPYFIMGYTEEKEPYGNYDEAHSVYMNYVDNLSILNSYLMRYYPEATEKGKFLRELQADKTLHRVYLKDIEQTIDERMDTLKEEYSLERTDNNGKHQKENRKR